MRFEQLSEAGGASGITALAQVSGTGFGLRGRGRPEHKGTALANVWFLGEERFERSGLLGSIIVRHGRRSWTLFAPAPTRLRD